MSTSNKILLEPNRPERKNMQNIQVVQLTDKEQSKTLCMPSGQNGIYLNYIQIPLSSLVTDFNFLVNGLMFPLSAAPGSYPHTKSFVLDDKLCYEFSHIKQITFTIDEIRAAGDFSVTVCYSYNCEPKESIIKRLYI